MYIRKRGRGFGDVATIPLSAWGMVSAPCVIGGTDPVTGDTIAQCPGPLAGSTPTTAPPGNPCAPAATFPFFGLADSNGVCQPLGGSGVALVALSGLLLFAFFKGGSK